VAKIVDDTEVLLTFFDFPAEYRVHLKTSNPIESAFATVRLRTKVTKGPGSKAAGLAMAFKLIEAAQDRWRAPNAAHLVALVRTGAVFRAGKLIERPAAAVIGDAAHDKAVEAGAPSPTTPGRPWRARCASPNSSQAGRSRRTGRRPHRHRLRLPGVRHRLPPPAKRRRPATRGAAVSAAGLCARCCDEPIAISDLLAPGQLRQKPPLKTPSRRR